MNTNNFATFVFVLSEMFYSASVTNSVLFYVNGIYKQCCVTCYFLKTCSELCLAVHVTPPPLRLARVSGSVWGCPR